MSHTLHSLAHCVAGVETSQVRIYCVAVARRRMGVCYSILVALFQLRCKLVIKNFIPQLKAFRVFIVALLCECVYFTNVVPVAEEFLRL